MALLFTGIGMRWRIKLRFRAVVECEPDAVEDIFQLAGLVREIAPAYYLMMMLVELSFLNCYYFECCCEGS